VLSNQDAVQLIRDMVRKDNDCEGAAAKLAKEAINRGSNDNVSCVVIRFNF
jgi:protein phosphatase 1L